MTQYSLFGAEVAPPTPADLDGVLLGGGHWVRSAAGARLSVVVHDRWRASALAGAYTERGVPAQTLTADRGSVARTGFSHDLVYWADRWTHGAREEPPAGFELTVGGLRLWAVVAGRSDEAGYLLGTADPDGAVHRAAGAQLARLGLAAVSIGVRGGPGWRVTSAKRARRLRELLGAAPTGAGRDWP